MSHQLEIRPQAFVDIAEAAAWYEERQPGLGERFTREVLTAIDALSAHPLIYRLRHRRWGARWCFPASIPYRIVYRFSAGLVTVVVVLHAGRQDRRWRERAKPGAKPLQSSTSDP